jgi:sarcosine oxidase subunit gamma
VAELIARSPLWDQAPLTLAGCTLSEALPGPITSVAPFRGQRAAVDGALGALGLGFPAPGEVLAAGQARMVWTGRDQAFLVGVEPLAALAPHAALTDQSDGWAVLALAGPGAEAVLARIVPIDVRAAAFPPGRSARVPFNHMQSVLIRREADAFEVMVFRSMAQTAWHEVETAMRGLAARLAIA